MADNSNEFNLNNKKRACVVVMGDIGRSPRMQYHCKSLLQENYHIDLIGYLETNPINELCTSNNIKIHDLFQFPDVNLWKPLRYLFKIIWQSFTLMLAFFYIKNKPNFILVQNPPAVPLFIICYLYSRLFHIKFIIDWHNYTHTIIAINDDGDGNNNSDFDSNKNDKIIHLNFIAKLTKLLESYFGSKADANFCVTESMRLDLLEKWSIRSVVLYDRPESKFQPIDINKKHEIFMKLSKNYSVFLPKNCEDFKERGICETTSLTQKMNNDCVTYKNDRPGILISSTSWTPDEDFNILLKALEDYDEEAKLSNTSLPKLICIITGKGPQKNFYKEKIKKRSWHKVTIITPWLEADDYPLLIASADLGVCLHWSSSGLDLPMKVIDMFGCGLPVCALNFKCINELVVHDENGFIFNNSKELLTYLKYWFKDFPSNDEISKKKIKFQKNLNKFQKSKWDENWKLNALPILNKFT